MRRLFAIPIAVAALALSACATLSGASAIIGAVQAVAQVAGRPANPAAEQTAAVVPATSDAPTLGDRVILRGTQGLIVANNAYQTAAALSEAYIRSGRSTAAQRTRIAELNDRAIALLEGGATGLSIAQRAAEVLNIVAELNLFGRSS